MNNKQFRPTYARKCFLQKSSLKDFALPKLISFFVKKIYILLNNAITNFPSFTCASLVKRTIIFSSKNVASPFQHSIFNVLPFSRGRNLGSVNVPFHLQFGTISSCLAASRTRSVIRTRLKYRGTAVVLEIRR